ncbi:MAG: hypothetical protein ABJ000_15655 [Saccharospirillum sp.]|uniref:hypothetical protein n=1 Tax=Saccharospirillum sp. TaxID=2033801 RepID=UPI003299FF12
MNEAELAEKIAKQVLNDTQFWIAIVGLIGVVIGSLITIAGNVLLHWLQTKKESALDNARKELLLKLLNKKQWRYLSTLSRVIGADEDTTRRLLIETGARASEKERTDGEESWGLISKNPLKDIE